MRLVTEVRRFRSDQGLRPGQRVAARLAGIEGTPAGRARGADPLAAPAQPARRTASPPSASIAVEGVTVELDVAGAIDVAAERRRMEKDLAAARSEADQAARKLANADFTAKAPADVVAKTRQRLEAAQADITRLSSGCAWPRLTPRTGRPGTTRSEPVAGTWGRPVGWGWISRRGCARSSRRYLPAARALR